MTTSPELAVLSEQVRARWVRDGVAGPRIEQSARISLAQRRGPMPDEYAAFLAQVGEQLDDDREFMRFWPPREVRFVRDLAKEARSKVDFADAAS